MKKVIIYGVYNIELRRKIEQFIDDEYIIAGYSDTFFPEDVLDHKQFIKKECLPTADYDFLVICISNLQTSKKVCEKLIEMGVKKEKIILPYILLEKRYMYQKDLLEHLSKNLKDDIETVIFGLSYSLRGINKALLNTKAFDFSWHGLDLYYNYKLFNYALDNGMITDKITTAIMVFPYTYFNHDMSRERYQFESGQIVATRRLSDWHNADQILEFDTYGYIKSFDIFGSKFMNYFRGGENIYNYNCLEKDSNKIELGHVWYKKHEKTIEENIFLFKEFISKLKKVVKRIVIIVPPYCLEKIECEDKVIKEWKKIYFDVVGSVDVCVMDMFENWKGELQWFSDPTHLNYEGAKEFTMHINKALFNVKKD